jgi:membrane associated rhomboid family serine protease
MGVEMFSHSKKPTVTLGIIIVNFVVYIITSYDNLFLEISDYWVSAGGFAPSLILNFPQWYRLFTSMFLHADFFHILFNMYFLYVFGKAVENVLSKPGYLALYLISGILACIFHTAFSFLEGISAYIIPAIGASGAISGVLGAYLILYPGTSLIMGLPVIIFPIFFRVKAAYYLIFWFATQLVYGYARAAAGTAVFAHAGGFLAGIAMLLIVVNREKISHFRSTIHFYSPPYLTLTRSKSEGLSFTSKVIIGLLTASLLIGTVYASTGLSIQGSIKSVTLQYACQGTPYIDFVGVQLPNIESYAAETALDTTRVLLNRLASANLIYNKDKAYKEFNLAGLNVTSPIRVSFGVYVADVNVNTSIYYFKGRYGFDGFLDYGEGSLTTQVIYVQTGWGAPRIILGEPVTYNFEIASQTVNLTEITCYSGITSSFITVIALFTLTTKDKELTLISEKPQTFSGYFSYPI